MPPTKAAGNLRSFAGLTRALTCLGLSTRAEALGYVLPPAMRAREKDKGKLGKTVSGEWRTSPDACHADMICADSCDRKADGDAVGKPV